MKDVIDYFNKVYDATFRELLRLCLLKVPSDDAHDLLQNTYARFYDVIRRRGKDAVSEPKAYLSKLLKHEIARFHRSRARLKKLPLEAAADEPADEDVEELGLGNAAIKEILDALRDEPELTRRVFILYYGYGMKHSEIAEEMGTTEAAVKSRLVRARRRIRERFE